MRPSFHTGFIAALDTPRIATSGALMIGVNAVPPMPPRLEMVKPPPCMSAPGSLPARAFSDSRRQRARDLEDIFLVGVADDGHDQAVRRVRGEADVEVLLEHEVLPGLVERAVEHREFAQRAQRTPAR